MTALEVGLAPFRQAVFAAPFGQLPLPFDRVGIVTPNLVILRLGRGLVLDLLDLVGRQCHLAAAGRLDDVRLARRLVLVQQIAADLPVVFEQEDLGTSAPLPRPTSPAITAGSRPRRITTGSLLRREPLGYGDGKPAIQYTCRGMPRRVSGVPTTPAGPGKMALFRVQMAAINRLKPRRQSQTRRFSSRRRNSASGDRTPGRRSRSSRCGPTPRRAPRPACRSLSRRDRV